MTDEQKIIDVSKCEWRTGVEHCGYYECMLNECCDYNCDWYRRRKLEQQLKRKEQECNKLYIQLKADEEYHKEEENTLRKIIKNKEERNIELYKKNNNLKTENDELKAKIKYMEEYIKTVENARDELERENKFSKEQTEQKLGRIRVIAFHNCDKTDKNDPCYKILQIIDEVE